MKTVMIFTLMLLVSLSSEAAYRVVGLTRECEQEVMVLQRIDKGVDYLLVVQGSEITQLKLIQPVGGLKQYAGTPSTGQLGRPTGYEVIIPSMEMSRLPEITIYLSGRSFACLIDLP